MLLTRTGPPTLIVVAHRCGHVEEHRIVVQDEARGEFRPPTERERRLIEDDLYQRRCNACLLGQRPGAPGRVISHVELPEGPPH